MVILLVAVRDDFQQSHSLYILQMFLTHFSGDFVVINSKSHFIILCGDQLIQDRLCLSVLQRELCFN